MQRLTLAAVLLFLALLTDDASANCLKYGNACLGGHGKRSFPSDSGGSWLPFKQAAWQQAQDDDLPYRGSRELPVPVQINDVGDQPPLQDEVLVIAPRRRTVDLYQLLSDEAEKKVL